MAATQGGPEGLPDDRAMDFVLGFPTAVAPEYRNRSNLATSPPLFVLRVPAAAYESVVDRVVGALRASLYDNGKLVPYAHLPAEDDSALLSESAGIQVGTGAPEHMTPERYPNFRVMRDLVAYIRKNPAAWREGSQARNLRIYASEQRAQRGGLLGFTRVEGPDLGGLPGFLVGISWLSFVQRMPKWLWARWTSRKVVRGWLGAEPVAGGGKKLFRVMDNAGAVWGAQLKNDPNHEEALQELDRLLLRALLEDLRSPAVGRILPGRRRRTARPVLLVEVPPPGAPGALAAERFLRSLHRARATARPPGPLVVAVGRPSEALLEELGNPADSTFAQASLRLGQNDATPVLVTFSDEAVAAPGLDLRKVDPRTFKVNRMVPTGIVACVTVLALAAGGLVIRQVTAPAEDHTCVGGTESVAESARDTPVPVDSKGWYDAAVKEIGEQNTRAERAAAQGRTVRTVVAFVSSVPTDENETRFDGTIPELRGIAMWQRKLLDDAVSNDSAVRLRVEVRPTGRAFKNAVPEARKLVAEVRGESHDKAYEKVVGVLAYAQSRDETRAALQVLGAAKIPTIGTTATADEMLAGSASLSYWPFTPANSTEARIEADFASQENIVAEPGSEASCSAARRALVIESSADLYSRSLADKFRAGFPGTSQVFNFNQVGDFEPAPPTGATSVSSADELARQLCRALKAEPESVVYWSARARDFTAFIEAMDTRGTCISDDITVLGGNELTNVAQTGAFNNKDWLRLYYSAHRLPATDPRVSDKTLQFVDAYNAFVKRTTKGADPWIQDGHSAVSYDAFHVLSQAVDQARLRDESVSRESVLVALGGGVTFNGATGYVSYDQGNNAPPADKTLVLLRQLADRPEAVVVCGAYRQGASSRAEGPPCAS
ncbi:MULTISPECIES: ABC transporter substrate-binding protein [unclassified Streptomyces]|uniref:ABC transporter substrate-binding protein n=1 Tax=unclassified Streptomyces TaxID=2593676 RepID=UPI002E817330|nr:ABC transporter substrate-binding protein [Streptomyces sp. NBC_00589]WTI37580.1 ABC transporter substrate-binding protein [Streptomyces sp. NBC_00775]WUB28742.1 ABC transporter substrate-binding protein [Streptomyces sp. NBC_00589]